MNPLIYFAATQFLFFWEVVLAIVVDDITAVFGIIATIAGTSLNFFIPSILFCLAYSQEENLERNKLLYNLSIANFLFGILAFCLYFYSNIVELNL